MRPKHWIKNLLVFATPLLGFQNNFEIWLITLGAFICFNFISSAIYLLNDCIDIELDRLHPKKKLRPIASGSVSRKIALLFSFFLLILSFIFSIKISFIFGIIIIFYFLIQVLYCLKLKNTPILDIFCISSGFLLRSISGGLAANLYLSPWFILTVGLLALFLALEKRKGELITYKNTGKLTRIVLKKYHISLLSRMEGIVTSGSFITYSLWASGPSLNGSKTSWMLITVPLVLIGIFRYQLISDYQEFNRIENLNDNLSCENPVEVLLNDNWMKLIISSWAFTTFLVAISNNG